MNRARVLALCLCSAGCTGVVDGQDDPLAPPPDAATGGGSQASTGGTGGTGMGTGGAPGAGAPPGTAVAPEAIVVPTRRLSRLSRLQWTNAIRDVLKLSDVSAVAEGLAGDAVVGKLDTDAASLFVDNQRVDFELAAQTLATQVARDAAALAKLVPANAPADAAGKALAFVTSLGLRAYRRPLTSAELATYTALFNQGPTLYPDLSAFNAGASLVIQTLLQSPHFLYRAELSTQAVDGVVALSDYEIAAKLALSLASTIPTDELLSAAGEGKVHTPADVAAIAKQLIESRAGESSRDNLHFQIYRVGSYEQIVRDAQVFKTFKAETPAAMKEELLRFTRYIFDQGLGLPELMTAPVSFINSTLAPIYGLNANFTQEYTRVDLDANVRAGLLTQPGFLAQYAIVNDPDTIRRGVFINQRILCVELPPPDPNAGVLPAITDDLTNRQRVEMTTGAGTCGAGCHSTMINPPGFAYEEFDAVGSFRTQDRGQAIDSASAFEFKPGGLKSFKNAVEFGKLLADSTQANACYAKNWMNYLNGRDVSPEEQPIITYLGGLSQTGKLSMHDLIVDLVTSPGFLNRRP